MKNQQSTIDELQKKLAKAEAMLDKSKGHRFMMNSINDQKRVTRNALSLVADISRERSMFRKSYSQLE